MKDNKNIPEGYFDKLPNRIMEKIEQEELKDLAPTLFGIEKANPFLVQDGYFEELPSHIREKAPSVEHKQKNTFDLRIVGAAASVAVLMLLGWGWLDSTSTERNMNKSDNGLAIHATEESPAQKLTSVEIETSMVMDMSDEMASNMLQHVEDDMDNISEYEIVDMISPEEIDDVLLADIAVASSNEAETSAIVDYLIDYDVNLEDVIAEL